MKLTICDELVNYYNLETNLSYFTFNNHLYRLLVLDLKNVVFKGHIMPILKENLDSCKNFHVIDCFVFKGNTGRSNINLHTFPTTNTLIIPLKKEIQIDLNGKTIIQSKGECILLKNNEDIFVEEQTLFLIINYVVTDS